MAKRFLVFGPLALVLWLSAASYSRAQQFDRTSYEVGVLYDDQVYQANIPCALDDLRMYVQWEGPLVSGEELTILSQPAYPPTQGKFTYRVSQHVYKAEGLYKAFARETYHCQTAQSHDYKDFPSDLKAYPRGAVGGLTVGEGPFKLGQEVTLTVFSPNKLKANPSGTRVYLKATEGAGYIDKGEPLARYVDIPSGDYQVKTKFRLGTPVEGTASSSAQVTITGKASNVKGVKFRLNAQP